jgi:hypothetical protein
MQGVCVLSWQNEEALTFQSFVCAIRRENAQPVFLRSYRSPHGHEVPCTIWEACRATAAATSLFDPIKIGPFKEEFVDGAPGFNNPVNEVLVEACDLWPETVIICNVGCILSIGTGLRANASFGPSVLEVSRTLLRIASETEKTAERFHRAYPTLVSENQYFRFNVQRGMEEIGLWEHKKTNILAAATRSYLTFETSKAQLNKFVDAMKAKSGPIYEGTSSPSMGPAKLASASADQSGSAQGSSLLGNNVAKASPSEELGVERDSVPTNSPIPASSFSAERTSLSASPVTKPSDAQSGSARKSLEVLGQCETPSSFTTPRSMHDSRDEFAARFANVKQLVLQKGHIDSHPEPQVFSDASNLFGRIPRNQFTAQQSIPPEFRHLLQKTDHKQQLHLIIQGLGASATETKEHLFPSDATLFTVINYLKDEGEVREPGQASHC